MGREETYIGFDAGLDLKRRVLRVKRDTGRSMAQIMRAFTEVGLERFKSGGDAIFKPRPKKKVNESQSDDDSDTQ